MFKDKSILVTGGTGSFGRAFVRRMLADWKPRRLVVYSRDELKQHEMQQEFNSPVIRYFIGDVRDGERLIQAMQGIDEQFGRGDSRHDQFYGDSEHKPNACLAPLDDAPFYAIPVSLGNLGTKGGLATSLEGAVLDCDGNGIAGLFACGNVAASWMGLGYPGAGGSLGPILTAALLCGRAVVRSTGFKDSNVA